MAVGVAGEGLGGPYPRGRGGRSRSDPRPQRRRVRLEAVADARVSHGRRSHELALDAALRAPTARAAASRGSFPEKERCARTPGRPWESPWGLGAAGQVCGCALFAAGL